MNTVMPADIMRPKAEVKAERQLTKTRLRAAISEHGEIAHLHRLMKESGKISYTTIAQTLNPDLPNWSQRVIDFAEKYVATKESLVNSQSQS